MEISAEDDDAKAVVCFDLNRTKNLDCSTSSWSTWMLVPATGELKFRDADGSLLASTTAVISGNGLLSSPISSVGWASLLPADHWKSSR